MKNTDLSVNKILLEKYEEKDKKITNWLITVFKNYYKKYSYEFNKEYIRTNEKDKYIKDDDLFEELNHILDFLNSDKAPQRIERLSYKDAQRLSNKWIEQLNRKATLEEHKYDTSKIADLDDGFFVTKLITKQAFEREGKLMNHCVASYYQHGAIIYSSDLEISKVFSLRDKNNKPHCTIEVCEKYKEKTKFRIRQIQGNSNLNVKNEYKKYAIKMMEILVDKFNLDISSIDSSILKKITNMEKLRGFTTSDKKSRNYLFVTSELLKDVVGKIDTDILFTNLEELEIKLEKTKNLTICDEVEITDKYNGKRNKIKIPKNIIFKNKVYLDIKEHIFIGNDIVFDEHVSLRSKNVIIGNNVIFKKGLSIISKKLEFGNNIKTKEKLLLEVEGIIGIENTSIETCKTLLLKNCTNITGYPINQDGFVDEIQIKNSHIDYFPFEQYKAKYISLKSNKILNKIKNISSVLLYVYDNNIDEISDSTIGLLQVSSSNINIDNISKNSNIERIELRNQENLISKKKLEIKKISSTDITKSGEEQYNIIETLKDKLLSNYSELYETLTYELERYDNLGSKYSNSLIEYNKPALGMTNLENNLVIESAYTPDIQYLSINKKIVQVVINSKNESEEVENHD